LENAAFFWRLVALKWGKGGVEEIWRAESKRIKGERRKKIFFRRNLLAIGRRVWYNLNYPETVGVASVATGR
jgi:hypothetical protein